MGIPESDSAAEAIAEARQGVEEAPGDVGRRRHFGLLLMRAGRFQEAEAEFRACIAENPESGELYELLSIPLERLGQLDDALLAAQHAAKIDGGRYTRVGQLHLSSGRLGEAEVAIKQALAVREDSALTHHLLSVILERQGRYAEALAAAHRAAEVNPDDPTWKNRALDLTARPEIERAQAAQRRGDLVEAARNWEQVRNALPERAMGYVHGAMALRQLRRFDDADQLIEEALQRFPNDAGALIESARISQAKGDVCEAAARWDQVMSRFPDSSAGYVGKASVLRAAKQFEEADELCSRAIQKFPNEHAPLIESAWIAHQAANWPEAGPRWDKVREVAPHLLIAYTSAAVAYWGENRFGEAETVLRQAMERFPDQRTPFVRFAETATRQNNWAEALQRWMAVGERFPGDAEQHVVHWTQVARMRLLEVDEAAAERATISDDLKTPDVPDEDSTEGDTALDMRDVMLAFESLGGQIGGCEFGNAQRSFGAEPLSLLRWAGMNCEQLIDALDARFEGVGDPEQTEVYLQDNHGRNEYRTRDKRFGMAMHTFIHEEEISQEQLFTQSCRRLKYLKSKLLDDLEAARKIFVYPSAYEVLTDDQLDRMHTAIRNYGDTTLLYVRLETEAKRHGTVEIVRPGLMVGYIDQFAAYRAGGRLSDTSTSWAPVCLNAYNLWQQESASSSADIISPPDQITATEEDRLLPQEQSLTRPNWRSLLQSVRRFAMPYLPGAKAPERR
jgi:tetratricopeptide (TPR) repeat protein